MSRKSRFASKERMVELRREGRVPVSALGIRLTLASVVLLCIEPLLPKDGASPILRLFEISNIEIPSAEAELQSTQSSLSSIGNLALAHLSIPLLGTAFLILVAVLPLALIQSKFFISGKRLRRTYEVRDTRVVVVARSFLLLLGALPLLWLLSTQVFSLWSALNKSEDYKAPWNAILLASRASVFSGVCILFLLGFLSILINQFWFRMINREEDGRFRKTRE